jgi:N6-L-threonylcarbamoyladenine synthase
MNILGIETSCDETACAVVRDGREVLSSVVYTQIPLHKPYGGVVPEVASRAHIEKISGVVAQALDGVGGPAAVDAVAVTYGPGLASSLLVGLNAAKGLALSLGVPLIGINHIEAHLHTPFLYDAGTVPGPDPEAAYPALGLAVSGGHTTWLDMPAPGVYTVIGQTLDDAAGEAFDKAAKLLGLGYPGGPVIDRWAKGFWNGKTDYSETESFKTLAYPAGIKLKDGMVRFPKGHPRAGTAALAGLSADLCVSFSGLKTALLYHVKKTPPANDVEKAALVAAYQEAIVGALVERTENALAAGNYRSIILGGGVSLNSRIREAFSALAEKRAVRLLTAQPKYCGDNAAMIAALAYHKRDITGERAMEIDVCPSLEVGA